MAVTGISSGQVLAPVGDSPLFAMMHSMVYGQVHSEIDKLD